MCGRRLGDLWLLDLTTMNWMNPQTSTQPLPRSLHSANIIGSRIFIFGGWVPSISAEKGDVPEKEWRCTNSLPIFNIDTLGWDQIGEEIFEENDTIPRARAGHSSVVINNRVYIWSGRDGYKKTSNSQVCCTDMWYLGGRSI